MNTDMSISKTKIRKQEWHQKKANRRSELETARATKEEQRGTTAAIVKKTTTAPVMRKKLQVSRVDERPSHSSPKSVQKIIPITDETAKVLRKWTGNVGEVGTTNISTIQKKHPELITEIFSCMSVGDYNTLITYDARKEKVFGLTPHNKGYKPKEGIRYLCEKPRPEAEPLFHTPGTKRPIYTTVVYPLVMKFANENIELLVSYDSEIAIPSWILMKETEKIATILIKDGGCSAVRINHFSFMAKSIVRKLNKMEEEKTGTKGKDNMWKLVEGIIERPPIFSALNQQEVIDLISEVIYTFENNRQIEVQAV